MIYQTRSELLYKLMCYPDVAQDAHTDHEKIIEALRGGQVYECVEAVMAHLNDVSQNIERLGINPAYYWRLPSAPVIHAYCYPEKKRGAMVAPLCVG